MSVHRNRVGGYDVRWREHGRRGRGHSPQARGATLRREGQGRQAGRRARAGWTRGRETLDDYVENTWAPIHVAPLAPKTRELYAGLYDKHVSPWLGGYQLRELTPEIIGRWQADRLAAGAPVESTRKALTLLGGILQRALEAGRIPTQPAAARPQGGAGGDRGSPPSRAGDGRGDLRAFCGRGTRCSCTCWPTPGCGRRRRGRCAGGTWESGR